MPDVSDLDIYRSANELIRQHGADAPVIAAMQADAMAEGNDAEGYATWRRICRAVYELCRDKRRGYERAH